MSDNSDRKLQLLKILSDLSDQRVSDNSIPEFVLELGKIYTGEKKYRHRYSDISGYLYANQNKEPEVLQDNFEKLYKEINIPGKYSEQLQESFNKLYDHVMLECIRIAQLNSSIPHGADLDEKIETLRVEIDKTQKDNKQIRETNVELREANEKINKDNKQIRDDLDKSILSSVTVLSIFTGIVMAFVGGFSILGSAFSNTELFETRVWLLIFLMSLVGFIFFNTVFMFIYMVAKLSGKRLSVQCKTEQCWMCMKCEECKASKVWCPFHKLWKKYPYVAYVNIVLLFMIVATGAYGFHSSFCSQRAVPANAVVEDQLSQTEQSLPSDIDFDIQLTNECTYGKADLEKGEKKNPRTGE